MQVLRYAAVATLVLLLCTGFAAAQDQESVVGDHWEDLERDDREVTADTAGFWDRFSLGALSVFAVDRDVVHPGDTVAIEHTLSSRDTERVVEADDTILAVETYLCADAGCDDPYSDQLVSDLSWRTGTDAIGAFGGSGPHAFYRGETSLYIPEVYTLVDPVTRSEQFSHAQEGYYATVIYVVDTAEDEVISDVWSSDDPDESERGRFQVAHQPPEIAVTAEPEASADSESVTGTVHLENVGGDMDEPYLVEMQVRQEGESLLSLGSGTQQLCDPDHPENVHTAYQLDGGESTSVTLETDAVEPGQRYDVWFVTGTDCMDDGGERTEPYGTGVRADTVCVGDCSDTDSGDESEDGDGTGVSLLWLLIGAGVLLILSGVIVRGRR